MKKILITGVNSYLGKNFKQYIAQFPEDYSTVSISMRDNSWRELDLSGFDTVYHVAGLAHSDSGHISREKAELYYSVNTELTCELAKKAKKAGVGQFIFMSSIIVYGECSAIGKNRVISADTPCSPANCYGDSKLQAEQKLKELACDTFKVVVLRPPMIYGKGCKGNYPLLSLFANKLPFFPEINNTRSILYVENLMEFVRMMIDNEESGLFFPQNERYCSTSDIVKTIAEVRNKNIRLTKLFNPALRLLSDFFPVINKAFGSFCYDMSISEYGKGDYRICSFKESIERTEGEE